MFKGKRDLLAQCMYWSGGNFLLNRLPARNILLVLVYHRIGDPTEDAFDPSVFSATGDHLNEHLIYLKRHFSLVTLEEALACIDGTVKERIPRCRVLITFDDGYLDNYEVAFPILRSHNAQGVFFLSTGLMGSCAVPWWDEIAFLVKTARKQVFSLRYPTGLTVNTAREGVLRSIRSVIDHYKEPANTDSPHFMQDLKDATQGDIVPTTMRRFLNWDEAEAMVGGGMAVGSHCVSHQILSQLTPEQQCNEMTRSRDLLRQKLGIKVESVAYPVGIKTSFSDETKRQAQEAGYRVGFSYYGGANLLSSSLDLYDVKRVAVLAGQGRVRFRVQTANYKITGKYWP